MISFTVIATNNGPAVPLQCVSVVAVSVEINIHLWVDFWEVLVSFSLSPLQQNENLKSKFRTHCTSFFLGRPTDFFATEAQKFTVTSLGM